MMMSKGLLLVFLVGITIAVGQCTINEKPSISQILQTTPKEVGKDEYLNSPFVTAGDRLYMVGHQNGSFPDMGWHVEGEMGGIWNHPIKLMDGFVVSLRHPESKTYQCLDDAARFINFPVGNQHFFELGDSIRVTRSQFVPDGIEGIAVELAIENTTSEIQKLEVDFTALVDLMPVWLSDSLGIEDGKDSVNWNSSQNAYLAEDANNTWYAVIGSSLTADSTYQDTAPCSLDRKGQGVDATLRHSVVLEPGSTKSISYYVAGSDESAESAWRQYGRLTSDPPALLEAKIERYKKIEAKSALSIPDKKIERMYTWLKYNTDWLIRDVEGVGRGVSAGIPDYPWWFAADNAYTLQGLLATGRFEEVRSTIDLLYRLSEKVNGNGRVIHEASTNGVVFNKGNMNETPHIIWLLWKMYEWTGNRELLETYYPQVQKGIAFLLEERDKDGNGYPNGHGMMEIHGLDTEMIDVAVYTQQALDAASKIAGQLDREQDMLEYERKAEELKKKINSDWWAEEFNSFADFRATRSRTLKLIDDAIIRADTLEKPWAVKELQNIRAKVRANSSEGVDAYVVHHNWVVNTPMEMAIADTAKALNALETARNYTSRYGMYVTGIDRDEEREESSKWEVFSYVGAVMTLPTGVQAVAEANYGNIEESYEYMNMLSNSFGYALPGSMYEVSPDYGMMVQAWNIYGVAVPVVEHYFGIKPKAYEKEVIIRPRMPAEWDNASIESVRIGDNTLDISKQTEDSTVSYTISQQQEDWTLFLILDTRNVKEISVNNETVETGAANNTWKLRLTGTTNKITLSVDPSKY